MQQDRAYVCRLIDCYGKALSDRQRDVIDLYYNEDLSLSEISEHCGITRQGVRDAIRHGVDQLLQLEKALGFAARTQRIAVLAAEISALSSEDAIKQLAERITGEL